jgi:hypothetical protein
MQIKKVTLELSFLIFFENIMQGCTTRNQGINWGLSTSTISKSITVCIKIIIALYKDLVNLALPDEMVETKLNNVRYKYFKGAIGAMDGTHITVRIKPDLHGTFKNRKGIITTNILILCNFNLVVLHAYVGCEGAAHDAFVLKESEEHGLRIPEGKYCLNDCGYKLVMHKFLTPYRGVRYHLNEWHQSGLSPMNAKELYNHRHAQLRNVVERFNGVFKRKFRCLRVGGMEYSLKKTFQIMHCCIAIHNFIRLHGDLHNDETVPDDSVPHPRRVNEAVNDRISEAWRNHIANDMWRDYSNRIGRS